MFDALTASRPYRTPDPDEVVFEALRRDARDGKLDPEVVGALARILPRIVQIREAINSETEKEHRLGPVPAEGTTPET